MRYDVSKVVMSGALALRILTAAGLTHAEEGGAPLLQAPALSPKAVEAIQLLESHDPYQRQLGFLRLEALRERATIEVIRTYIDHRDPETRAYSLRALAAIEGSESVPLLLQKLSTERHPRVRRALLLGLEPFQKQHPDLLLTFMQALRDRDTAVRMTAVDIVSRIDDPRAREALVMRNKYERRRDVRRVLALAMKRIKGS